MIPEKFSIMERTWISILEKSTLSLKPWANQDTFLWHRWRGNPKTQLTHERWETEMAFNSTIRINPEGNRGKLSQFGEKTTSNIGLYNQRYSIKCEGKIKTGILKYVGFQRVFFQCFLEARRGRSKIQEIRNATWKAARGISRMTEGKPQDCLCWGLGRDSSAWSSKRARK